MATKLTLDDLEWVDLQIPANEMRPIHSLNMGQCFNWKRLPLLDSDPVWVGILFSEPLAIKQTDSTTLAAFLRQHSALKSSSDKSEKWLKDSLSTYFQLQESLPSLYQLWSQNCDRMKEVITCLPGVRVVQQEPWECLISFICSSNNNISRIVLMLDRLRSTYGKYLCSLQIPSSDCHLTEICIVIDEYLPSSEHVQFSSSPAKKSNKRKIDESTSPSSSSSTHQYLHLYTFPSIVNLASASEEELRGLGVGYRAKFIKNSAQFLLDRPEGGDAWLHSLRLNPNRLEVQQALVQLPGVGMKVADCVALFSLDQREVIPVDTHVWSIAIRDYAPELRDSNSLTPVIYEKVGDVFRRLFTRCAGWAHSVLFAAELPTFRALLPDAVQQEMKDFVVEQKKMKEVKKDEVRQRKEAKLLAKEVKLKPEENFTADGAGDGIVEVKVEIKAKRVKKEKDS